MTHVIVAIIAFFPYLLNVLQSFVAIGSMVIEMLLKNAVAKCLSTIHSIEMGSPEPTLFLK